MPMQIPIPAPLKPKSDSVDSEDKSAKSTSVIPPMVQKNLDWISAQRDATQRNEKKIGELMSKIDQMNVKIKIIVERPPEVTKDEL